MKHRALVFVVLVSATIASASGFFNIFDLLSRFGW
jgi:hypothetical protein